MRLLKVHVPDFRGLKNVEINFEQDLTPQVFPVGGENGAGKSTLLQLVFTLLHCIGKKPNLFLWNLINNMKRPDEKWKSEKYDIAKIEILFENKHIKLEFFIFPEDKRSSLAKKNLYICGDYELPNNNSSDDFSLCVIRSDSDEKIPTNFWEDIRSRIFLAGQTTQAYLFLSDVNIRELFKLEGNYEIAIKESQRFLSNFYTYNHSAIMEILETFKAAIDEDQKQAIATGGSYGTAFKSLLDEFKQVLSNRKYIFPTPELDGITVRYQTGKDEFIDLGPGDLSHGELKRLSLYSWIRNKKINNSIVLIDEIENGLHPDWQYNIVRDLAEWGDNNQYILATHSFYLCEALTPRHVKVLEPAMKNPVREKN